jgi:DNA-binding beta-propeller fold protein YncE
MERSWRRRSADATLLPIVLARTISVVAVVVALAGCGSATDVRDFPPPATPAVSPPLSERPAGRVVPGSLPGRPGGMATVDGGRAVAVVRPRERVLEVYDGGTRIARAPAGIGPTNVAGGRGGLIYVVDTTGDGLLVFELRPRLHLRRRLPILGRPYGIASDPAGRRLWVTTTATNRLVELADGARPHRLRDLPAVRQPDAVAVRGGRVYVSGRADGVLQIVDGRGR